MRWAPITWHVGRVASALCLSISPPREYLMGQKKSRTQKKTYRTQSTHTGIQNTLESSPFAGFSTTFLSCVPPGYSAAAKIPTQSLWGRYCDSEEHKKFVR